MEDIYILIDYLDRFESKVPAIPYRSGFDKNLLKKEFTEFGYNVIYLNYSEIDFAEINFTGHLLETLQSTSAERFSIVIEELRWHPGKIPIEIGDSF